MMTDNDIARLASLARVALDANDAPTFSNDLAQITAYFEELKQANTEHIQPLSGGTDVVNSVRIDANRDTALAREEAVKAFPETHNGFLSVPPVFEE